MITLEDLGLEIFHDQWMRVKLWRMEEHYRLEQHLVLTEIFNRPYFLKNKRHRKAYGLRVDGCTYKVIGKALNVSTNRARQMVLKYERALKRTGEFAP